MSRLRLALVAALVLAPPLGAAGGEPAAPPLASADGLVIRVVRPEEWKCEAADVEKVLRGAAGELWRHFPGRSLAPIEVAARGGPIVLFDRGPRGEFRVRLNTGERLWAQMAYQFAHEFTHILCAYDTRHAPTKWFEESLCETASLFVLRRMAQTWQTRPPYPNWRSYAPSLASYAADRLAKARLPQGQTFPGWYRDNAEALRANATDRSRNNIVAGVLLPLLEARPQGWGAVAHLNKEVFPGPYTFEDHLRAWRRHCPPEHKALVTDMAQAFGLDLGPAGE